MIHCMTAALAAAAAQENSTGGVEQEQEQERKRKGPTRARLARERYDKLRGVFNASRPSGSPSMPPVEERLDMKDLCQNAFCRYCAKDLLLFLRIGGRIVHAVEALLLYR